ncbi:ABC transporter ATP-binding protein [Methylobacterium organophilum]|uniref:Galactose/methyl galactoside import ATP-binding protein MglA n=1 Tax=Methylobacterium organophilum TaxID=410 RepID=A0ABQ4TAD7_METOR|nr:ABC transporter ATP-binding protein [Methylobacterium organophilum]GJE27845.1 Galactose/methyl galactoside import ATP-binding protein MglA [Methylobacterium organophilum]
MNALALARAEAPLPAIEAEDGRTGYPPGTPPLVELQGITKTFPGVLANDSVDLDVMPGEIHALLGENGAGKSTLMNVLTGIYKQDAGRIIIDGYAQDLPTPQAAIAAGIGMVHQHFKLVPAFTVAENVHLGWPETPWRASAAVLEQRTRALAERFNLAVRPDARVGDLSAGEQQRVEILRVLARSARILILDEPTAVLTPQEAQELFRALRAFREGGNGVIFISHKLDEVIEIADRISVLRGGRKVATQPAAGATERSLAALMVGHEITLRKTRARRPDLAVSPRPFVELKGIHALDDRGLPALHDLSIGLHGGEILGIAGVAGNGQRELSQVITGMRPITAGTVLVDGKAAKAGDAAAFAKLGIGHIPEDRLRSGLAPSLSITDNAVLREYGKPPIGGFGLFRPRAAGRVARAMAKAAEVAIPSFEMPVRNLSGGNQQRLVARREVRIADRVLVAAYPSRGLDVGAIDTLLSLIAALRDEGKAVLLFSEELEELLELSDRIAVLFNGRIMGTVPAAEADIETLGLMMGGQRQMQA